MNKERKGAEEGEKRVGRGRKGRKGGERGKRGGEMRKKRRRKREEKRDKRVKKWRKGEEKVEERGGRRESIGVWVCIFLNCVYEYCTLFNLNPTKSFKQ